VSATEQPDGVTPTDDQGQSRRKTRKARPPKVRVFLTGTGDRRDAGKVRMFSPEKAERLIRDGHARR
jgi:hypothetical protein